jgi:hypothetical protein
MLVSAYNWSLEQLNSYSARGSVTRSKLMESDEFWSKQNYHSPYIMLGHYTCYRSCMTWNVIAKIDVTFHTFINIYVYIHCDVFGVTRHKKSPR